MAKSEFEKMLSGEWFNGVDPDLLAMQAAAGDLMEQLAALPERDFEAREKILQQLLGSMAGRALTAPPFSVEFGRHIHLGHWVYVNRGSTFLDSAPIIPTRLRPPWSPACRFARPTPTVVPRPPAGRSACRNR